MSFKVGDYVRVKSHSEQILDEAYYDAEHHVFVHPSGHEVDADWCGKEGYILQIRGSLPPRFVVLDSGPTVPEWALSMVSLMRRKVCECGKDRHGFMGHSTWCPLYQSPWED